MVRSLFFVLALRYLAVGSALTVPAALATAAPCPTSLVSLHGSPDHATTAAVFDTADTVYPCHVSFDLPQGKLEMDQSGYLGRTTVDAADAYDVAGVPAGTPVNLTAELIVDGSVSTTGCGGSGCGGYVVVGITHGAASAETTYAFSLFQGSRSFHDVRRLPVTIVAGTPEEIRFKISGGRSPGGSHASEGRGTIAFADLPAGVSMVSCQGFGSGPTPVRHQSWGELKVRYR